MVKKYIILCGGKYRNWKTPRQLYKINNETIIERTIRLLKENGISDIAISTDNPIFEQFSVPIIKHKNSFTTTGPETLKGYWLDAFPIINEPVCYLLGDVYFSKQAIKDIVNSETNSVLFFCSFKNSNKKYIKQHDEPFGFKVENYKLFQKHIKLVKSYKDKGLCCREPIAWELYRSINGQDINVHKMTKNYIAINDETCDIDKIQDYENMKWKVEDNMIKLEAIRKFSLNDFDKIEIVSRADQDTKGILYQGDVFLCQKPIAEYLLGDNKYKEAFVKVIEVIPKKSKPKTKTSKK